MVTSANAGVDGSECDLDFVLNAIPGSGTGTWTEISGPGNATFSPDPNQADAIVTVDQSGEYEFAWTVVNNTCQSTDLIKVTFHDLPSVSAGRDTILCIGESVPLEAQGVGSFHWTPDSTVSNPDVADPVASPLEPTNYIVTLTDQYGCINTDTALVDVWEIPVANAGPDLVLEYLYETTTAAEELKIHETGVWSFISGKGEFSDSSSPLASIYGLSLGENIFLWTVSNGICPSSNDQLIITVHDLVIPTLITPNMDGKNDYFVLRGIETLGKTELVIFNRWGAQVYKNGDYNNDWDGVDYNSNPLPDDTYFFVIKTENGKSISGYLVIRR